VNVRFECNLPGRPDVVWPYVTWPDRMNEWSEARVELVTAGEGGRPDGAGATRRVIVPVLGFRSHLQEVVEESLAPSRFVYRVTSGIGLRQHRGQMRLEPVGDGTRLIWEVTYRTYIPGLGLLMNWLVGSSVRRSLAALERLLRRQATAAAERELNQPLERTGGA
jgi:hypothetical protein